METGDLVRVRGTVPIGSEASEKLNRGWKEYPGEYNYHSYVWVTGDCLGMVVESREGHCRLLLQGHLLWFDRGSVDVLRDTFE